MGRITQWIGQPQARGTLIAVALWLACLGLNIYQCATLGLHRLAPLWVVQAIPAAISDFEYDRRPDYAALTGVHNRFQSVLKDFSSRSVNRAIKYTVWHKHEPLDRRPHLISVDDKGIVDFVKLAFVLFGYQVEGVAYLYFLFLALSSGLYLARFIRERWALVLLYAFLLAHACALPPVSLNPQFGLIPPDQEGPLLGSMLALRFMPVLGMVAMLHLIIEILFPRERLRWCLLAVAAQAGLLLFLLHIRFSTVWEVLCIVAAFVVLLLRRGRAGLAWGRLGELRPALLAVGLLLAGCASLSAYKKAVYAPEYFTCGGPSHFFWHSVYSGLAYSPELARDQGLKIDDLSVYAATDRFLVRHGREPMQYGMHGSQDAYDEIVREMFFEVCRERPGAVLLSLVYYRPLALVLYAGWYCRLVKEPPMLHLLWDTAEGELSRMGTTMDSAGRSYRLIRIECLLPLVVFAAWARRSLVENWKRLAGVFALFFAGSLLPALGGYPTAHTIWEALLALGMLVYLGTTLALVGLWMGLENRRGQPSAAPRGESQAEQPPLQAA